VDLEATPRLKMDRTCLSTIALSTDHVCEHVRQAVNARVPIEFYLQKCDDGTWYSVCEPCARLPKDQVDIDFFVCDECEGEWADQHQVDPERWLRRVEEFPD